MFLSTALQFFILPLPLFVASPMHCPPKTPALGCQTNRPQGETVIDLGSGGGFDVFQAAKKVGPTGKSIGVDISDVSLSCLLLL